MGGYEFQRLSSAVNALISVRVEKNVLSLVDPEGATHLPDGWATFVRNLTAKNEEGTVIQLQYLGEEHWKIPAPLPQNVDLSS